jgi:hypothetical protein
MSDWRVVIIVEWERAGLLVHGIGLVNMNFRCFAGYSKNLGVRVESRCMD